MSGWIERRWWWAVTAIMVTLSMVVGPVPSVANAGGGWSCGTTPLTMTWNSASAGGLTVGLAIRSAPFDIDWGDGTIETVGALPGSPTLHTYGAAGEYTIRVCGVSRFGAAGSGFAGTKTGAAGFTAVTSFASTLTDLNGGFAEWTNLTSVPSSLPATVTTVSSLFYKASSFNDANVVSWNTANVTDMSYMFQQAAAFNRPIGVWDVGNVTTFTYMFASASVFDQDIGAWNTSKAVNLVSMFELALVFNNGGSDSIKNWNTANVTSLAGIFASARAFNQPIGSWNTSKVTSLRNTFTNAWAFNQPIGSWDTSKVTTMQYLFQVAKAFNQPIGSWDTSKVTTMQAIFYNAEAFDQDISTWNLAGLSSGASLNLAWNAGQSVMSVANYDKLLIGWSTQTLNPSVTMNWGAHKYSCAAVAARAILTSAPKSWNITDGGETETAPTITTIVPSDTTLTVNFTAPTCMSPQRTSYEYSVDGGATWTTVTPDSLTSPIVISGLINGTTYAIQIRATGGAVGGATPASSTVNGTPSVGGGGGDGGSGGEIHLDLDIDHYLQRGASETVLPDTL